MRHTFHISAREGRLLGFSFSIGGNPEINPEAQRQLQGRERQQNFLSIGQVPNAMNQRMNTTSERLGKTRDEYMEELRKQYNYLTSLIEWSRTYTHRIAQSQRGNARGQMAISPRFGGPMGPMAMERDFERRGAEARFATQFGSVQELEQQRDWVRIEMAKIAAERKAGIPDPALQKPAEGNGPIGEQEVGRITPVTTAEVPPSRLARFKEKASAQEVEVVMGLPEQLQEIAAVTWERMPEAEKKTMMDFLLKMKDEDEDTLREFFRAYFKDGVALDPEKVTVDDKSPVSVKAAAFAKSLSPAERGVAERFIKQGMEIQDGALLFEDLNEVTKKRVLKYVRRWNKAEPDSAEKLIAEGMLYLDAVDVESSVKGKEIKTDEIKMLPKEGRFMGFIAGWIKLILGWKKLLGTMKKGEKPAERKDPSEMTKADRDAEIVTNEERMTEITGRMKVLPDEISVLEKKIADLPADASAEEKVKMTDALKAKKKELEDGPREIEDLKRRNEALKAAPVTVESEIPESEKVAFKKATEKAADLSAKYGVTIEVEAKKSQIYDRSLIVLENIEKKLASLPADKLAILKAAKPDTERTESFLMEGVSIMTKTGATDADTLLKDTLRDVLSGSAEIDADPRIRLKAEKEKFKADFARDMERYIAELETNPVMKGMLEKMGVDVSSPEFKKAVKTEKPKLISILNAFVDATTIEPNAEGKYRIVINLGLVRTAAERAYKGKGNEFVEKLLTGIGSHIGLAKEGDNAVSEYRELDELLNDDLTKEILKPIEKEPTIRPGDKIASA